MLDIFRLKIPRRMIKAISAQTLLILRLNSNKWSNNSKITWIINKSRESSSKMSGVTFLCLQLVDPKWANQGSFRINCRRRRCSKTNWQITLPMCHNWCTCLCIRLLDIPNEMANWVIMLWAGKTNKRLRRRTTSRNLSGVKHKWEGHREFKVTRAKIKLKTIMGTRTSLIMETKINSQTWRVILAKVTLPRTTLAS